MMPIEFIAQHLSPELLKLKVDKISTVCSFTGLHIKRAISNKDLIKKTFTDQEWIKYPTGYSSIEAALCIEPVISGNKGLNSLRNYSFIVTDSELKILKRDEIISMLLNPPSYPFILCVTFSNKKHISYKSSINYSATSINVTTDQGDVLIEKSILLAILPIIQNWYTIIEGKKGSSQESTFFTKKEILNGCNIYKKIVDYGVEKYFRENQYIDQYRNTAFLKLIVHLLNKA